MPPPKLELEESERKLTQLLQEAHRQRAFSDPKVEIRYAGGWVRDKIMGLPSHDIDIALSSLSGHTFAQEFVAFLAPAHPELQTGTVAKIQANPEKSKHLDTATARLLGLDLDFVQLRTESYADSGDTRTPSVTAVGTLLEDAERRDFTMNALFYNVHTEEVEDPTGRGLRDLEQGMIQTPLPPRQTFLDDPLRVLRGLRFASQFGFQIEGGTLACTGEADVQSALERKVVRERIGIEVFKMMRGSDPASALRTLQEKGLYEVVFAPLPTDAGNAPFETLWQASELISTDAEIAAHYADYWDGRIWLMLALLPYRHARMPKDKRGHTDPLACGIIRDRLKLTNALELLCRQVFPPVETTPALTHQSSRRVLGEWVRRLGKDWKMALLIETVGRPGSRSAKDLIRLLDRVETEGLTDAFALKNTVDGKKIKEMLTAGKRDIKLMSVLTEFSVLEKIQDKTLTEEQLLTRLQAHLETLPVKQ